MADAVVEIGENGAVTLAVFNRSTEPIVLKEGEVLGELREAAVTIHSPCTQPDSAELKPEQVEKLQELVVAFAHLCTKQLRVGEDFSSHPSHRHGG